MDDLYCGNRTQLDPEVPKDGRREPSGVLTRVVAFWTRNVNQMGSGRGAALCGD